VATVRNFESRAVSDRFNVKEIVFLRRYDDDDHNNNDNNNGLVQKYKTYLTGEITLHVA